MNNVLPESMEQLPSDPNEAIRIMDKYIRYMSERIDFYVTHMSAKEISFDNKKGTDMDTGLEAKNVQDAIVELARR